MILELYRLQRTKVGIMLQEAIKFKKRMVLLHYESTYNVN